ncbi:hypothetical protein AVDCRST_MAG92-4997 [uncultured Coleofasciculus sp.]|uniref:GTP cyclohydrolase 1 type 2 homolog n=1 Tax=uncultured Coleofasciculus sp. TaxID=1267456 RepID=A0A6J4K952_9CYAN|nr:hypothetical protein AVDCRST_MAG92-4997 [uncultured Coleofasciculus sp.]
MLSLDEITQFLNQYFAVHQFKDDQGGVYRSSTRPVRRIGLALESWTELAQWANEQQLDALFLHRPWKLQPKQLEPDVGVISYHLAFDERLTLGFNPRLAEVLGMSQIEVFGEKQGRAIGMLGKISPQSFENCCSHIDGIFGGKDKAYPGSYEQISRVTVVGAMTEALVEEAALRGADLYITGQWRVPAEASVLETGINVIAVGHRRCEEWGLRSLAGLMRERWFGLQVICSPSR